MADVRKWDPTALEQLRAIGGADLVTEILRLFLRDGPKLLDEARRGAAEGRWTDVRRAAHTLKSNAASLGAAELRAASAGLEECARTEDAGALPGALSVFESECLGAVESAGRLLRERGEAA